MRECVFLACFGEFERRFRVLREPLQENLPNRNLEPEFEETSLSNLVIHIKEVNLHLLFV